MVKTEDIKFTIKMIAAYMGISLDQLADLSGINRNHLKNVSAGRVDMTARDLKLLSEASGIPYDLIQF